MLSILPMHNPIQNYAWGSREMLATFLGYSTPPADPLAELWMGAHPSAPSQVYTQGRWVQLDELIQQSPDRLLGKKNTERFGPHLPFLFKVLAVDRPLSLQVHPNAKQAWVGYQKEEALAVAPASAERSYKDPNPKPECICALEPFWGLNGFRPPEEIERWFAWLAPKALRPELDILDREEGPEALSGMLESLLHMEPRRRVEVLEHARSRVEEESELNRQDPRYWMAVLLAEHPGDIGALAPVFLQLMHLSPGQAAFLPPGRLHAYLSGLGLEIMANSDNVLRAGLTSKHIDVQELLKTMDFDRPEQGALEPVPGGGGWFAYPSFTEEFVLSGFELGPGCPRFEASLTGISILLCVQGELEISDQQSGEGIRLVQGQSVCIPGCVQSWTASGRGRAYVAETGVNLGSSFPDR